MKTPGLTIEFAGVETWPEGSATIIEQAIDAACDHQDVVLSLPAELSILLADDAAVRALNCEWRGKDSPTNVLSFPADSPSVPGVPRLLGDIVFARETVEREAVEQNKAVEAHIMHLAIHGFLHLLGFDHIDPSEAENMEAHEVDILATLDVANPYLDLDAA